MTVAVTVSGTILGGLIAATAGILAQMYALRHQNIREQVNWYRQLEHLTQRLHSDLDTRHKGHIEDEVLQDQHEKTVDTIASEIDHHFGLAPVEIPEKIHESQDKITMAHMKLQGYPVGSRSVGQINIISDEAEKVGFWAREQRHEIEQNFYYRPRETVRRVFSDSRLT